MRDLDVELTAAEIHLDNWARYMRSAHGGRGYPSRAAGFSTGGVVSGDAFDDLCEVADLRSAMVSEAIIDSLEAIHRDALCLYKGLLRNWMHSAQKDEAIRSAICAFWIVGKRRLE